MSSNPAKNLQDDEKKGENNIRQDGISISEISSTKSGKANELINDQEDEGLGNNWGKLAAFIGISSIFAAATYHIMNGNNSGSGNQAANEAEALLDIASNSIL